MRAEMVTIEPFARRCVRWPPRASRGSLRQEIPPPTFGRGEARLSGAVLWCGRTSGGPRACICINRMGDQSLKNTRGGFLRSICTPANFICRGKWRTVGCVLARTPGRDARRRKDRGTRPSARHHADPSHQLAGQVCPPRPGAPPARARLAGAPPSPRSRHGPALRKPASARMATRRAVSPARRDRVLTPPWSLPDADHHHEG